MQISFLINFFKKINPFKRYKISIVIPVYNVEQYLVQCLESVVNQTFKNIEIICVNDCSTDNSGKILKEYAMKYHNIVVINNKKNLGVGITRNIGQKMAKGKYILFLDPDDYITLDACELLYSKAEKNKVQVVYFNFKKFTDGMDTFRNGVNMKKTFQDEYTKKSFYAKEQYELLLKMPGQVWFKLYKKSFLKKYSIQSSEYRKFEDSLFKTKLLLANPKIIILNKYLYFYRLRKDSLASENISDFSIFCDVNRECIKIILNSSADYDTKVLFLKTRLKWLFFWTNRKIYDENVLIKNRNLRKNFYNEIFTNPMLDNNTILELQEFVKEFENL